MSPALRERLTNLVAELKRTGEAIAQFDKTENEVEDMTFGDVKLHFVGLSRKIGDHDRVIALFEATLTEDWS